MKQLNLLVQIKIKYKTFYDAKKNNTKFNYLN